MQDGLLRVHALGQQADLVAAIQQQQADRVARVQLRMAEMVINSWSEGLSSARSCQTALWWACLHLLACDDRRCDSGSVPTSCEAETRICSFENNSVLPEC